MAEIDIASSFSSEACLFRPAAVEDMPSLAQLYRLAIITALPQWPVLHTPEEDREHFRNELFQRSSVWIVELHQGLAGFIAFRPGWVDQLHVHPNHQGQMLGSRLLNLAKSRAATPELRLWTFQCNTRARRFYEKHGFEVERLTDGAGNEEKLPDVLYVWTRPT
jgi:putative acetyltransferase